MEYMIKKNIDPIRPSQTQNKFHPEKLIPTALFFFAKLFFAKKSLLVISCCFYLEIAHSNAWEVDGVGGIAALHNILYDLDAIQMKVLVAQQHIEQEELSKRVGQVAYLDEEVETDEVGAADGRLIAPAAAHHVARVGAGAAAARGVREAELLDVAVALLAYAALAASPRVRVLIDRLDHVEHDLVPVLELLGTLVGASRLY